MTPTTTPTTPVTAAFDFRGDPDELAVCYHDAIPSMAAMSSGWPVIHRGAHREYGFMVVDAGGSREAPKDDERNDEFRQVLFHNGLPDPVLRVYPVHDFGWPVHAMPMYR